MTLGTISIIIITLGFGSAQAPAQQPAISHPVTVRSEISFPPMDGGSKEHSFRLHTRVKKHIGNVKYSDMSITMGVGTSPSTPNPAKVTSPRDIASGQSTGKRQHQPVRFALTHNVIDCEGLPDCGGE